ncbi:MAG: DUF3800 domain-containing protein [Candidatus Saccharimonadia bacterium]
MDKFYTTEFCFFDETGLLNSPRDKFFAVGMIKLSKPESLYLQIKQLRDKHHVYDEIKWSKVQRRDTDFYKELLKLFFDHPSARFSCYIFKKTDLDLKAHFNNALYVAYQSFAVMQVCANLSKTQSAILLMDDLNSGNVRLEQNIKMKVNRKFNRNAVYGVCRLYSKGVELIQLNDLILGAVAYGLKMEEGLIPDPGAAKLQVLSHVKKFAKIKDFRSDYRDSKFDIWHFKAK